jgi:hypothetical protein
MNILEQNDSRHCVFQYKQAQNQIVTQAEDLRRYSPVTNRGKPDVKDGMNFA